MSGVMVPYVSARPLRGSRYLAGGRLGALGTSPIVGTVASKGAGLLATAGTASLIGTAAGTAGGALFGAAAGSVVPVIGTIIGAVVGILTSKLFGHANYAAVYANIDNVRSLYSAWTQVAGQYPGRMYGWPELQYVWHGAMVSGLFPGNGPPAGATCTQAMISNKINACGTGQWIDNLLGSSKPTSPGTDNIAELIAGGLARGIVDPVTMTSQVLVPGIEAIAARKNNGWISVARSSNPQLYTQLLEDTADLFMSEVNPNMPVYYGPLGVAPVTPPPTQTSPVPQNSTTPVPAGYVTSVTPQQTVQPVNTPPALSPSMVIKPRDGQSINAGLQYPVTFVNNPNPTGEYPVYSGNQQMGALYGTALAWDGVNTLLLGRADGSQYRWVNNNWVQTQAPTVAATIPITPTPATVAAQGGTIVPVDQTAAYIASLQAQGQTQQQAMLAAIAQLQAQGLSAQAAQSTVAAATPTYSDPTITPQAAPVVPTTAGLSNIPASAWAIIGGAVLLSFALARPKNSRLGSRRR
jgi:uncharacterized membrane protein (Fun14 family)